MSDYWLLEQKITFLNHGSYGATPIPVLDYQMALRKALERQPIHFLARELEPLLDQAKTVLADFIGTNAEDLAFIPNATFGVNSVLRSLNFAPGDEILITDHTYNACRNALNYVANRSGIKVVVAAVPFPLESSDQVISAILDRVSEKTKLALLDHVTSSTALIFPIENLVRELEDRGIDTLVDGAHGPGFMPLNVAAIGAAYYTGNCHKWLCAPKGAGFLYVRPDKQEEIRPLIISHGANSPRTERSRFRLEFDWLGTDDPTAYLSVPKAIEFMGSLLPGGWPSLWQHNHDLACKGREMLCQSLGVMPPCPPEMMGAMATINLGNIGLESEVLYQKLVEEYHIEIPVIPWHCQQVLLRISAQVYNVLSQYEYLADVLKSLQIGNRQGYSATRKSKVPRFAAARLHKSQK